MKHTARVKLGLILDSGYWIEFCNKYGFNEWCINEGASKEEEVSIEIDDLVKWVSDINTTT